MKLRTPLFAPEDGGGGTGNIFSGGGAPPAGGTPPAGTPPAGTPPAGGTQPPAGGNGEFKFASILSDDGNSFKQGWTETLPDELKPAKDTLGRYKNPIEALRGLHNANVKMGKMADAVLLPNEKSTPEEIAEFREKAGIPQKPEDYGVKKPDNLPAGVQWDDEKTKTYVATLHKHNASPALVKELVALRVADEVANLQAVEEGGKAFIQQGLETLRKEWGGEFDSNIKKAEAVVNHYSEKTGLKLDHVAFQFPEVIRFVAAIHKDYMGESKRIEGGGITGNDPANEARLIQTDESHPMHKRYMNGEPSAVEHVRGLLMRAEKAKK